MKSNQIALVCGVPNDCDRCKEEMMGEVIVNLPQYGKKTLCKRCLCQLVENGLEQELRAEVGMN